MWNTRIFSVLMIGAATLFSGLASAQEYVGVAVGNTKWSSMCWGAKRCSSGSTTKLNFGYAWNKNFAVEASVYSLGDYSTQLTAANFSQAAKGNGRGVSLAGVFNYELSADFSGFAKLGIASMHSDGMWNYTGENSTLYSGSEARYSTQALLGLGVKYKLTDHVALTLELEQYRSRYHLNKPEVRTVTTGIRYEF